MEGEWESGVQVSQPSSHPKTERVESDVTRGKKEAAKRKKKRCFLVAVIIFSAPRLLTAVKESTSR